jgi:mannose/fructose/N-acetylgalactosamine-specific phosphotransferase system component IID
MEAIKKLYQNDKEDEIQTSSEQLNWFYNIAN